MTHFLEQVYEICDRITVLRNGELVDEYAVKDLPRVELIAKMMGKELEDLSELEQRDDPAQASKAAPFYQASGLSSTAGVASFDFTVSKGEVNGFIGLLGSGRSESVRAIFGADKVTGGQVKVAGKGVRIVRPIDAMKQRIAYLSEDRKGDGIIADLSVRDNIILALQVLKGFFGLFPLPKRRLLPPNIFSY